MPFRDERGHGVPCLRVADLPAAARHYRSTLGFEQVAMLGGIPPTVAVMKKFDVIVLLQACEPASPRPASGPPWDAVLLVSDLRAAHHDFAARDGVRVGPIVDMIGWPNFEVTDVDGRRLCVGHSWPSHRSRLVRPPRYVLASQRARWRAARSRREEAPHLERFRRFQAELRATGHTDVFYMFFTTGYLHWASRAAAFVPPDVDLVLIGSALAADERQWLAEHVPRPLYHVDLHVDDLTMWEFLFDTAEQDFGWIDTDCFVLDPAVFRDMVALDPGHAMNCTWSWDSGYDFRIANPHLLFINAAAIDAVRGLGVPASPAQYSWDGAHRRFRGRPSYMTIPSARERDLLLEVLPSGWHGQAQLIFGDYYDTTEVFQIMARLAGYPINAVRDLARRCGVTPTAASRRPEEWPQDMSDELFHLYGVSYYDDDEHRGHLRSLFVCAELAVLDSVTVPLPEQYDRKRAALVAELAGFGVEAGAAAPTFRRHLVDARGMSERAAEQVLPLSHRGT
jgi:hypothetical protein